MPSICKCDWAARNRGRRRIHLGTSISWRNIPIDVRWNRCTLTGCCQRSSRHTSGRKINCAWRSLSRPTIIMDLGPSCHEAVNGGIIDDARIVHAGSATNARARSTRIATGLHNDHIVGHIDLSNIIRSETRRPAENDCVLLLHRYRRRGDWFTAGAEVGGKKDQK